MEEQLLPLLLEHTAGKRSSEILKNINERDQNNQRLSAGLVRDQMKLFDEAMSLQLDALTFAAEHASQWSQADRVIVAIACRTFNHLRAAAQLLLSGYWAESMVIERSAFESLTREWYFYKYPKRANRWLRGGQIGEVRQGTVREALGKIQGEDVRQALLDQYAFLCLYVHPNIDAILLQTWNSEEAIGRKNIMGGYINRELFPVQFGNLLVLASTATMMLGIVGFHEARNTWKQECEELQEAVYAVGTNEYQSLYSSLAKRGI